MPRTSVATLATHRSPAVRRTRHTSWGTTRRRLAAWHALFDERTRRAHRQLRLGLPRYLRDSRPVSLLTAPVIYSLTLPLLLLDAWVTLYQWICFPIYGIARVRRRPYFVVDRHKLGYLNAIEKANCLYCSYATGVFGYVREVAARTEQYWCPIRHARPLRTPHARYRHFFDYGDATGYRDGLERLRRRLRPRRR